MQTSKLNIIMERTYDGSYVKVKLNDGREVECKVDCFNRSFYKDLFFSKVLYYMKRIDIIYFCVSCFKVCLILIRASFGESAYCTACSIGQQPMPLLFVISEVRVL